MNEETKKYTVAMLRKDYNRPMIFYDIVSWRSDNGALVFKESNGTTNGFLLDTLKLYRIEEN